MNKITDIRGYEILDSRGNPTVLAKVQLSGGQLGVASVPSGASTGSREAVEMRDNDPKRYRGKGVLNAVNSINSSIRELLIDQNPIEQTHIDQLMLTEDNTENKSKLGANSILAVSLATCRAASMSQNIPLYKHIGNLFDNQDFTMPVPMMNILNGGEHADNNLDIQEFMIQPLSSNNFSDALRMGAEIFHHLKDILKAQKLNTAVGDEGGFAPNLPNNEAALTLITDACKLAGYQMGKDIGLAMDCAASEFFDNGQYHLKGNNSQFNASEFTQYLSHLCDKFPIISIEDGMDESDWDGWTTLTKQLGNKIQLVGDDLFVTNTRILKQGIERKIANSILIKPNQIGTLTETLQAIRMAKDAGYTTIISHRSGETGDDTIADIAVATGAGQIKTGSLCRYDRMSKYNRLLIIESELSGIAPYQGRKEFKWLN